ncbi:MAG: hypothetical protein MJ116_09875 [Lachnospiraceae bacterium]|nr:hypothetical protein [Lachnospiraceae bacterium]
MKVKLEILEKGDSVLSAWENHVAVKRKNGEVEILQFYCDEGNMLRLSNNSVLITYGHGTVSATEKEGDIEITTF